MSVYAEVCITIELTNHFPSRPNDVEQLNEVEKYGNGNNASINCVLGLT